MLPKLAHVPSIDNSHSRTLMAGALVKLKLGEDEQAQLERLEELAESYPRPFEGLTTSQMWVTVLSSLPSKLSVRLYELMVHTERKVSHAKHASSSSLLAQH